MKKILFMLAGLLCMFASCSDGGNDEPGNAKPNPQPEEQASITMTTDIPTGGLVTDVKGGELSVSFSTNKDWTLSVAATTGGTDWCSASATGGNKGDATVKFTVKENTDYDDRSVSVTIKAGTASQTFKITQKGADALLVTTTTFEVPQEGGTIDVEVKANIDYQLEIAETAKGWITEANSRSMTTQTHSFAISPNEDGEKREGEIHIKSGDKLETVKVYQAGSAVLLLSQNEYTVSDAGETITVDVKSNVEYGVEMPEVDWIVDEASARGMSSHTLQYTILPNETYDSRSAEIIFYDKNSDLKETLTITQTQKDAIVISQKEYVVKAEGETIEVKLSANVDYEITMPEVDWISQVESRGLVEHSLYFKVAENESEEGRSAEILFTNVDSHLSETIVVTQEIMPKGSYDNGTVTINTAGYMKRFLGDDFLNITSLKIVGPINGNDVYVLRQMLGAASFKEEEKGKLATLDLSEATLVEGGFYLNKYIYITGNECFSTDNMIGTDMFSSCENLQKIILPKGITAICETAFSSSKALTSITIHEGCTTIDNLAFYGCSSLTSITIPNSVTSIGESAFNYCHGLKSVIIGDGVVSIGSRAFNECGNISSITIGKSVATIGEDAFFYSSADIVHIKDLSAWCKIKFANKKAVPGTNIFLNNEELIKLIVPEDVTEINDYAFINSEITELSMGNNITSIGREAFFGCRNLTSVVIPESVTSIGREAFYGCISLKSVVIGDGVTSIGEGAFKACNELTSVTIGNSVASIGDEAFMNCRLSSLKIPTSVTSIGHLAFYTTKKDECYCYATTPPSLENQSFYDGIAGTLYVPTGCVEAYKSSDWSDYFENIVEME